MFTARYGLDLKHDSGDTLRPTAHYMYRQVSHLQTLRSAHTSVFICFVWISEQTAIISLYSINWLVFITETECLLRGTDWILKYDKGDTVQPTGHYMYRQVTHSQTLRSAHTAVFICFVWISEQTAIISLYNIN